ncbi:MAG: FixH family protein [Chakrabartia sp.]
MIRRFTGWHMTAILVSFFGIVVAVNLLMARYAVGTFGGTVVDNSYVASQNYNRWLAEADNQAKLAWKPHVALDLSRRVQLSVTKDNAPLLDVTATGAAIHPLGKAPSITLTFMPAQNGILYAQQILPTGRWRVQLSIRKGSDILKLYVPVE